MAGSKLRFESGGDVFLVCFFFLKKKPCKIKTIMLKLQHCYNNILDVNQLI